MIFWSLRVWRNILRIWNHKVVRWSADNCWHSHRALQQRLPDLALLDIQIKPENIECGWSLAEIIRDQSFLSTFLSFFTTSLRRQWRTVLPSPVNQKGPFGYLVKPYGNKVEVNAAIQIAKASFWPIKKPQRKLPSTCPKSWNNSLFLKVDSKLIKSKIEDILFVEANGGTNALFKTKSKGYIVHTTINECRGATITITFKTVHRSYIDIKKS